MIMIWYILLTGVVIFIGVRSALYINESNIKEIKEYKRELDIIYEEEYRKSKESEQLRKEIENDLNDLTC
jgi:hypothetical protein